MKPAAYVVHEGKRRRVLRESEYAGEPGYDLEIGKVEIWARLSECQPWRRCGPIRRVLRAEGIVLEFSGGRALDARRERSPKRFAITFRQIFDCAARIAARVAMAKKRAERQARRRR
jgi:hypothetical protein